MEEKVKTLQLREAGHKRWGWGNASGSKWAVVEAQKCLCQREVTDKVRNKQY